MKRLEKGIKKNTGIDTSPNTLHNCCVALSRSSALATRLVSRSTSGTLAFADANANVSCSETLVASLFLTLIVVFARRPGAQNIIVYNTFMKKPNGK
jgi:hypothetical protein